MKKEILISIVAGLSAIAGPAAAKTVDLPTGVTLLSDSDMDSIVAGETIEVAQFLRTSDIIGYVPGTDIPIYRTVDMSGLPDEGAELMFSGTAPDTNGTTSVEDVPAHPIAPLYMSATRVGTPSDGYGAAFVTLTLETP